VAVKPRLIRKKIEVWGAMLVWSAHRGGIPIGREHLANVMARTSIPRSTYTVIYRLNTKGEFLVSGYTITKGDRYAVVCFLPKQWNNHRVSREVKVDE